MINVKNGKIIVMPLNYAHNTGRILKQDLKKKREIHGLSGINMIPKDSV